MFSKVEEIIREQIEAGNYSFHNYQLYSRYHAVMTIPKSGSNPRIIIEFGDYSWNRYSSKFSSVYSHSDEIDDVTLKSFMNSRSIVLHDIELRNKIQTAHVLYWEEETKKKQEFLKDEDESWAAKFRKAFAKSS